MRCQTVSILAPHLHEFFSISPSWEFLMEVRCPIRICVDQLVAEPIWLEAFLVLLKKVNVTRSFVEISLLVCHIFVISFLITFLTSFVSFLITVLFISTSLPFLTSYRVLRSYKSRYGSLSYYHAEWCCAVCACMCYKHFALHSPKNFFVFSQYTGPTPRPHMRDEHSPVNYRRKRFAFKAPLGFYQACWRVPLLCSLDICNVIQFAYLYRNEHQGT